MFEIRALKVSPTRINGVMRQKGRITIGNWYEWFIMPLNYWNIEQYKTQWKEGIVRLKTHDSSCLITAIVSVKGEIGATMWIMYKEGVVVYFQWHFFPNEDPNTKSLPRLDSETCYQYIRQRFNDRVSCVAINALNNLQIAKSVHRCQHQVSIAQDAN
jgi:hypothetical protein